MTDSGLLTVNKNIFPDLGIIFLNITWFQKSSLEIYLFCELISLQFDILDKISDPSIAEN